MRHTHQKKPYRATATQLTKHNVEEMKGLIEATNRDATASLYGSDSIMVRFANPLPRQCTPNVMNSGDWLVVGENGVAKLYTDEQFKVKYEELDVEGIGEVIALYRRISNICDQFTYTPELKSMAQENKKLIHDLINNFAAMKMYNVKVR